MFIKKHKDILIAGGIFILALLLRTYRLPEFIAYHQDQVRDLLFIKDHLENGQIIYLGPKASVGNFFLAPLWYYLMALVYLVSNSPVAPALMVAILNSGAVIFIYFFMKKFFTPALAIPTSLLYAVSPFSIEYSRFAWNPNPIPFFAILAIYSLYVYIYENKKSFIYLAVVAANFSFQLHYQGFLLVAAVFIFPLFKRDWKRLFVSGIIFLGLLAPFFIYEVANGYPNLSQIAGFLGRTTEGRSLGIANSLRAFTTDYPEFLARVLFAGFKPAGLVFSVMTYFMIFWNLIFMKSKKWNAKSNIYLILSILLMTLFAYRQWIVPYYLLVALIPVVIVTALIFERMKMIIYALILLNLFFSPAFAKTDSSLRFFEKSVSLIKESRVAKNCIQYSIIDPDLKFAPSAVGYLTDIEGYKYPEDGSCAKQLYFCELNFCDKIKGVKKLESGFLGLAVFEK